MKGVVLAYIGVHQIFQLALAAQELGALQKLFCSFHEAPGSWGRWISKWTAAAALRPMGAEHLDAERVTELPLALVARRLRQVLLRSPTDYHGSNVWFDRSVAARLPGLAPRLFVGTETCALESIRAAKRAGVPALLDCPGIPGGLLAEELACAEEDLKMPCQAPSFSGRTEDRKAEERQLADHLLVCSILQRDWYARHGIPEEKMSVNPLWVDPAFAAVERRPRWTGKEPLRVLFAGHATVAKGAPYLIQAMQHLDPAKVTLTFCGGVEAGVRQWAGGRMDRHHVISWVPRTQLADIYQQHDVLVFPSLGDAFGFVALEAMACGLPVIATANVGAPVASDSWRVPVRDATALAAKLVSYADDRDRLDADGVMAQEFARAFTTAQFRARARAVFQKFLS
jgi:glycosyltransferase involved in cell wall biosynthesis